MLKKIAKLAPLAVLSVLSHTATASEGTLTSTDMNVKIGFSAPFKCTFDNPNISINIDKPNWDSIKKTENISITCENVPDKTAITIYYNGKNNDGSNTLGNIINQKNIDFFDEDRFKDFTLRTPLQIIKIGPSQNNLIFSMRNPAEKVAGKTGIYTQTLIGTKEFNTGSATSHAQFTIPAEVALFPFSDNSTIIYTDFINSGKSDYNVNLAAPLIIKATDIV